MMNENKKTLPPQFPFQDVEEKWCRAWEESNVFHARSESGKEPYTIVIPPPNVTGILHMGHALNNTLQDIMVRYQRMKGREVCWMPGTDHAGIATQNVVERALHKEGKTRHDIGREALLERLWAWKQEYGDTIINQLKRLGASCDWARTRFTMDEGYSRAVREVFVRLFEKGLIYQGQYIIHWCPRCQTALSDEEAEHAEVQGALYHIRYPLEGDPRQFLTVATTRPETMLGDTAVAVHPEDARFAAFRGRSVRLPLTDRTLPVIDDDFVNPEFGTGAVKVTPGHDPNDFAIGQRHNLPIITVMHPDGRMNQEAGDFAEMDRFEARAAIVETLKEQKLLEKVEHHTHAVQHCYRCHTVVEPMVSKQWFVRMKPLAEPALAVVREGRVRFLPERWRRVYENWMENIRDWCISRQIWWGHRIPAWTCLSHETCPVIVSREDPQTCPHCGGNKLEQDPDVLDTWFSSWLWPFATFGWPEDNDDLKFFYPGHALFTASEIIFFWVARMIMAGLEFMEDVPFRDVYIHGTVRDAQGRKMSKSLGNAIDPLEIIRDYGADALRFSLIINSGQDIFISKEKFEIGRNFANKIWNAARFLLMKTEGGEAAEGTETDVQPETLPQRWILSRLQTTLTQVSTAIEEYRFSEAETLIHEFFWNEFCGWFLEISKENFEDATTRVTAVNVFLTSLKLMHPFLPFVTEELWQTFQPEKGFLCRQDWPQPNPSLIHAEAEQSMTTFMNLITQIRRLRVLWNVPPAISLKLFATTPDEATREALTKNAVWIQRLSHCESIDIVSQLPVDDSAVGAAGKIHFALPLEGRVDIEKEKARMAEQLQSLKKNREALARRLDDDRFLSRAPQPVIEKEKARLQEIEEKINDWESILGKP